MRTEVFLIFFYGHVAVQSEFADFFIPDISKAPSKTNAVE